MQSFVSGWWRRQVMVLAVIFIFALSLHLLISRHTVQSSTSLSRPAAVDSWLPSWGALAAIWTKNNQQGDPFENMVVLSSWPPKVQYPLMVFQNPGRLGNRLNSYASALVFHLVHRSNATVAVTKGTVQQVLSLVDPANLTLAVMEDDLMKVAVKMKAIVGVRKEKNTNDQVSHLEPAFQKAEKQYLQTGEEKVYALGGYPNRMWLLGGYHDTIRATFTFRQDLKIKVAMFFERVMQQMGRRDITFVGFHIRRKDYTRVIKKFFGCATLPGQPFYNSAMDHYRATLHNPVFVVGSDDIKYARSQVSSNSDVVFSDMKTPAEDMALLGSCSHAIMTVGSFGFWTSFFTGGQVVYPLIKNCTLRPFVHPDNLGPRGYENWLPFDFNGGGPVALHWTSET